MFKTCERMWLSFSTVKGTIIDSMTLPITRSGKTTTFDNIFDGIILPKV